MGFLDRLLGRTKKIASDAGREAGELYDKGRDKVEDALDRDEGKDAPPKSAPPTGGSSGVPAGGQPAPGGTAGAPGSTAGHSSGTGGTAGSTTGAGTGESSREDERSAGGGGGGAT